MISDVDISSDQYVELDITATVEDWRVNNLTKHYGLAIQSTEFGSNGTSFSRTGKFFNSSNAGSNVPELVVTQIPEPASLALVVLGGVTLLRRRPCDRSAPAL